MSSESIGLVEVRQNQTMTIEEKVRQIMLSEELSDAEKFDSLHALIPLEAFKIDDLKPGDAGTAQAIERWLSSYRSNATDQTPNCRQRIAADSNRPRKVRNASSLASVEWPC